MVTICRPIQKVRPITSSIMHHATRISKCHANSQSRRPSPSNSPLCKAGSQRPKSPENCQKPENHQNCKKLKLMEVCLFDRFFLNSTFYFDERLDHFWVFFRQRMHMLMYLVMRHGWTSSWWSCAFCLSVLGLMSSNLYRSYSHMPGRVSRGVCSGCVSWSTPLKGKCCLLTALLICVELTTTIYPVQRPTQKWLAALEHQYHSLACSACKDDVADDMSTHLG